MVDIAQAAGHSMTGIHLPPGVTTLAKALPKWRKALANARSGVSPAKLGFPGDSTTRGSAMALSSYAWPSRMAAQMAALNIPICADSGFGCPATPTVPGVYDPRVSLGAGWAPAGVLTIGGRFYLNTTTLNAISFTPTGQFDTVDVYYAKAAGFGTFNVDIDGGAATSVVSGTAPLGPSKVTLTAALGVHTVNITPTTLGSGVYVTGWDCYDSSAPKVRILNTAAGSARAYGDWNSTSTQNTAGGALLGVSTDLQICMLGLNDESDNRSLSDFGTAMDSIITNAKVTGDIILLGHHNGGHKTDAVQDTYRSTIKNLAITRAVPYIDIPEARGGSYADMVAGGWMVDTLHPNRQWDDDLGRWMAGLLFAM